MEFITTTQLRTHSTNLVSSLAQGKSVKLVHRSKIIGDILPKNTTTKPVFDASRLEKASQAAAKKYSIPYDLETRDKLYRNRIMAKYGKSLS